MSDQKFSDVALTIRRVCHGGLDQTVLRYQSIKAVLLYDAGKNISGTVYRVVVTDSSGEEVFSRVLYNLETAHQLIDALRALR